MPVPGPGVSVGYMVPRRAASVTVALMIVAVAAANGLKVGVGVGPPAGGCVGQPGIGDGAAEVAPGNGGAITPEVGVVTTGGWNTIGDGVAVANTCCATSVEVGGTNTGPGCDVGAETGGDVGGETGGEVGETPCGAVVAGAGGGSVGCPVEADWKQPALINIASRLMATQKYLGITLILTSCGADPDFLWQPVVFQDILPLPWRAGSRNL